MTPPQTHGPIASIAKIRNIGVFREFTWPPELPALGRYNLIYGWNGTGKTTLSRLLQDLEAKRSPATGDVTIAINGQDVTGEQFAHVSVGVRVFNREFVDATVFRTDGDVAPILVLGKENVDKQKQVDELRRSLIEAQARLSSARQSKSRAEDALDNFCIDRARVIKDTLRSSGTSPYNNYNKTNFSCRAEEMQSSGDHEACELDDAARAVLLAQHKATPKPRLQPLAYQFPDLKCLADTIARTLRTTVCTTAIETLKDDPVLASWVHEGLGLHQSRSTKRCLFCNGDIPDDRLRALEAHFSAEYKQFLQTLQEQVTTAQKALAEIRELQLPRQAEFHDDLSSEYEPAAIALHSVLASATRALDEMVAALAAKKNQAFERIVFDVIVPESGGQAVHRLNTIIQKHNEACDDLESRRDEARKRIEADSVAHNMERFISLIACFDAAKSTLKEFAEEIVQLNDKIANLEREIVEHLRPAEELNQDLRSYLGHGELQLAIKDNGYTIVRHGSEARGLSEGEKTAIALLYFLKSLEDRRFDLRKGVVVLDDPVSSLDANALYYAFGFIRSRAEKAAQLIVLTHNFSFFRQVRNWYHHLPGQRRKNIAAQPARFYMLDCTCNEERRSASIRRLDPLLEQFESEYHYLFAYVYRAAEAGPRADLEQNYLVPNVARRLLEAFLAFRQPQIANDLRQKMDLVTFDEAKKIRILRFLHTNSHDGAVEEPEHDLSLLRETEAILRDLLDLMKAEDAAHVAAMVSLLSGPAQPEENE